MTREEAIKELKEYEDGIDLEYATPFDKAILYAIKALSQEPIKYWIDCNGHVTPIQQPSVTQKSGKWIPVSERLPEDKTYVLTTIKVPNRVAHARSGWYQNGYFHNDNGDTWKATDIEVKAWMPLPEPYKAESKEQTE